jgi:hypothetical protein
LRGDEPRPDNASGFILPRHQEAYEHYEECRAIGHFPDDPIVARNAAIFERARQAQEAQRQDRNESMFQLCLELLKRSRQ